MLNRRIVLVIAAVAALAGCAIQPKPASLAATIAATPELSTLSDLVIKSGLTIALDEAGPLTIFAPTNEAFSKIPAKTLAVIEADPIKLKALLTYHAIQGQVMARDIKNGNFKSVNGANLALSKAGDFVTVEDGMVQKADISASNGVIHIVDSVLIPPAR